MKTIHQNKSSMRFGASRILLRILCVAMAVVVFGCSDDWNDHYDASSATQAGTLWEAISSQQNLSNFARVAKACGYDLVLNGSQTFSVFAPTNDALSSAEADSLIAEYQAQKSAGVRNSDNTVVRQFLQNHISLFRHPVSSLTNDSITMMNNKYEVLAPSALGSSSFATSNALYNNGVLFTLNKTLDYFPNVFEYLAHDSELDSVYSFMNSFSVYEFNEAKSVPGEIVDGQIVYLDSVSELTNTLFNSLGEINSEDSIYWLIAPTNSEWNRLVEEYAAYFNYHNNVPRYDSLSYTNARRAIVDGTVFSLTRNSLQSLQDSAVSTMASSDLVRQLLDIEPYYIYQKPFGAGGVFDGTDDIVCSNGHVRKASHFNVSKYQSFLQTVKVEGENIQSQNTITNAVDPLIVRQVPTDNPFYGKVSGNTFVEIAPETATGRVQVSYNIPALLSNVGYDVYGVFVPATAYDTLAVEEGSKPTVVYVSTIDFLDQNGRSANVRVRKAFNVQGGVVDSVLFASNVSIPTCSYGLTDPQVTIEMRCDVLTSQTATHTRTLRLDCIIFKPHDLDAIVDEKAKDTLIH